MQPVNWSDVILTSDGLHEDFSDVTIVTLKSHFLDTVYDTAISQLHGWCEEQLHTIAQNIIATNPPQVCEHVNVTLSKITVVIDVPEITDDTIWPALDMVATALHQLNGTQGIVKIGHCGVFNHNDLFEAHLI